MKVIFCTPTATPPAWLTEKYPEVLNAQMDGVLLRHGLALDTALEAVTVNPARLVGAIDRIGTIEPGKDADIAIFDGMPFSNQTLCRFTMIDGVIWNDTLPQNEKTEETNGKRL